MLCRFALSFSVLFSCVLFASMAQGQTSEKYARLAPASVKDGIPWIDFHTHLKGGLTMEEVLAHTKSTGIVHGVAPNCGVGFPITDDAGIDRYLQEMKDRPVFLGMQAEGREWVTMFSAEAVARFDYVFSDAMTFTDDHGNRTRLWMKDEVHISDPQAFMEMYVNQIVYIMTSEPIDIYANPTFLPAVIAKDYDRLWTKERMEKVIDTAVGQGVAIEINATYHLPSPAFIKLAKSKGVKFSFGTNNGGRELGNLEYCREMVKECHLTAADLFVPKPNGKKRIQKDGFE